MPSSVEPQTATVQSSQLGTPVLANGLRGSSLALAKETAVQEVQSDKSSTSTNTVSSRADADADADGEHVSVIAGDKELEVQTETQVRPSLPQPQRPQLEPQEQQVSSQQKRAPKPPQWQSQSPAARTYQGGSSRPADAEGASAPPVATTAGANAIKLPSDAQGTATSGKREEKVRNQQDGGNDTNDIEPGTEDRTASGLRKGPLIRMLRKVRLC
ncbi:hypothetical protein BD289DRAFT_91892 [Coniella lustricola]|uniref:Uncharacterized protein n=1 Tax=Coniella lustricola TaxID=2025994 RepID=A0A2T3AH45_9PEZI|nr:hypothetical protein BD289DRAFT_91892 [Coniella lustricola]